MNKVTIATLAIAVSFSLGLGVQRFILTDSNTTANASDEKKPLYWVAPMDPGYKRDKPGKSPMGMDLVPVYEEQDGAEEKPGTITISPEVVNNLGVRTAPASIQSLTPDIQTVGLLGYNEDSLIQVNSRVEGWVENLNVGSVGEFVSQGDKLFDLYSPALVNAQEELLAAVRSGNKALILASKERLGSLDITTPVVDRIIRNHRIERTLPFYADRDGYVSQMSIREGGYVNPSKPLIELANLDTVWVVADVFERQSLLVKAGQKASMTVDYLPGQVWEGNVDYVYPTLDPVTRSLRVRLRFDNPDAMLKPNMYSKVAIFPEAFDALSIPRESLIRTGKDERVVKALGDGKFRSVKVLSGREVGGHVEILKGLVDGDRVVTSAQFLLDSESSISADLSRFEEPDQMKAMNHQIMEHSAHDDTVHEGMNHSEMDHSAHKAAGHKDMSHGEHDMGSMQMDHGEMDHSGHDMKSMPMDHATMDHSDHGMPEKTPQHEGMNHSASETDHSKMGH